jgi:hypothetical protein
MMEEATLTQVKEPALITRIIEKVVKPMGYKKIKANVEDYEIPAKLSQQSGQKTFIPDITGRLNGRKSYFELAVKTDKRRQVVTKWKLLANLAKFKGGKLFLIAPRGHYAFAKRLLDDYPIEAKLIKV